MDLYLMNKFKGKYRILAELDQDTNDFVKNADGVSHDESFADFYIKCRGGIKIKHAIGNELSCYIQGTGKGMNILRSLLEDKLSMSSKGLNNDEIGELLVEKGVLVDCDILDGEVYFIFKTTMMDDIAALVKPKTSGASISPFSVKNLPKSTYTIPKKDLDEYNKSREGLELKDFGVMNRKFLEKYNIVKQKGVKPKELIHKNGLWQEYCDFIKKFRK